MSKKLKSKFKYRIVQFIVQDNTYFQVEYKRPWYWWQNWIVINVDTTYEDAMKRLESHKKYHSFPVREVVYRG